MKNFLIVSDSMMGNVMFSGSHTNVKPKIFRKMLLALAKTINWSYQIAVKKIKSEKHPLNLKGHEDFSILSDIFMEGGTRRNCFWLPSRKHLRMFLLVIHDTSTSGRGNQAIFEAAGAGGSLLVTEDPCIRQWCHCVGSPWKGCSN